MVEVDREAELVVLVDPVPTLGRIFYAHQTTTLPSSLGMLGVGCVRRCLGGVLSTPKKHVMLTMTESKCWITSLRPQIWRKPGGFGEHPNDLI